MKKNIGYIIFIFIYPLLWFVMPLTRRVRCIFLDGEKVLVARHFLGVGTWHLPGGGIKFGESPEAAAVREIKEELGLDISAKDLTLLNSEPIISSQLGLLQRQHYVVLKNKHNFSEISKNWEISEAVWIDLNKIPDNSKDVKTGVDLASNRGK